MINIIKNHPDYTAIDNALNSNMPECILHLITSYTVAPKTHLFKEIKKNKTPSIYANIYIMKQIKSKIIIINQTNTIQHRNTLRYQLFNYIIDNKPFILNKNIAFDKLLKSNFNYLYYNLHLINLTYYHKLLFGYELPKLPQLPQLPNL